MAFISAKIHPLLKAMLDNWRDVFENTFSAKSKAWNCAFMALEARNATAHLTLPLQDNEALRYLDVNRNANQPARPFGTLGVPSDRI